ncbi:MAG: hypothetical protein WAM60_24455 [Candidatus Promineifilaceae bacterium]
MERKPFQFKATTILRLLLIVLALSACSVIGRGSGSGEETNSATIYGNETPLSGEGYLICSQECSDRGFCGTTNTGVKMVLLNTQGPATQTFDVAIPENTLVPILGFEPELATLLISGEQLSANYYVINNPVNGQPAWVAGWCLGQPQQ